MSSRQAFFQITVVTRDDEESERISAEAFEAGAQGIEESSSLGQTQLILYAPEQAAPGVYESVLALLPDASAIGAPELVPERDWSECWKQGLAPIVVSSRLVVRPSFTAHETAPGQRELVIDPGQAFGTGGHASTRLMLEWIDALAGGLGPDCRVLDVGSGTGVLAMAISLLSACRVTACDLDPLASRALRENVLCNPDVGRIDMFTGSTQALASQAEFDLVLANMLRSELEPLIEDFARHLRAGGQLVLAGLLATDCDAISRLADRYELRTQGTRQRDDDDGVAWSALLMRREPAPANR